MMPASGPVRVDDTTRSALATARSLPSEGRLTTVASTSPGRRTSAVVDPPPSRMIASETPWLSEQVREVGGGHAHAVAGPPAVDRRQHEVPVGPDPDRCSRVGARGERRDRPDARLAILDRPLAPAHSLGHILPPGRDRGPDRDWGADREGREGRRVRALRRQDEGPGRDGAVAASRAHRGHGRSPRAADPERQRCAGQDDLRPVRERSGRRAPTPGVEDQVAAPAGLVDAVDGQRRRAVGQGHRGGDRDVAEAWRLRAADAQRGPPRRGSGEELAAVDVQSPGVPDTGRRVGGKGVAVDRGHDPMPVAGHAARLAADRRDGIDAGSRSGGLEADARRGRIDVDELDDLWSIIGRPPARSPADAVRDGLGRDHREGHRRRGRRRGGWAPCGEAGRNSRARGADGRDEEQGEKDRARLAGRGSVLDLGSIAGAPQRSVDAILPVGRRLPQEVVRTDPPAPSVPTRTSGSNGTAPCGVIRIRPHS